MAGATLQVAQGVYSSTQLSTNGSAAWSPPHPSDEQQEVTSLLLAATGMAEAAPGTGEPVSVPLAAEEVIGEVWVPTANAFGDDPFDENGCPIISASDMAALSTIPYAFGAVAEEGDDDLPPLPEGYDVMPLAGATGIFVETEDFFRFRAISTSVNVAVSFFGRVQRPSGYLIPFNHTLNTSTANTTFTTTPVPGKGILLGCAASVPIGSITAGAVNAIGEIGRMQGSTFTPHTLLFSGQLDDLYPLSTEGGGIPMGSDRPTLLSSSSAGPTLNFITLTITPSTGKRMRFVHGVFINTSTAAAGDRVGFMILQQGGTSKFRAFANMAQGPSSAVQFAFSIGANGGQVCPALLSGGVPVGGQLPESLYFYDAVNVLLGVNFAADSITAATVFYEES